jgi:hypothetical protein
VTAQAGACARDGGGGGIGSQKRGK